MKQPASATGHRPNKLHDAYPEQEGYKHLVWFAVTILKEYQDQISIVGSGMALGWDMAIADACLTLDIPFVACIPFAGQSCQWPLKTQQYYDNLLKFAYQEVHVCDPGYAPWKMQRRNEYMVDNSAKQFALWNKTSGGTANCVRYAKSKGVEVINCWDRYTASVQQYFGVKL